MSKQITVIARLKAKPEKTEELKELALSLLEPTRAESGCINYDLHRDLEDPTVFYFYENWSCQADLDAHFKTPHIARALQIAPEIFAEPMQLTRLEMLGKKA
jgi:quinol monooxygenase YgiN